MPQLWVDGYMGTSIKRKKKKIKGAKRRGMEGQEFYRSFGLGYEDGLSGYGSEYMGYGSICSKGYSPATETVTAKDKAVEDALNEVAGLMCSRHLTLEDAETSTMPLRYVMGYNGPSVIRNETINGNKVKLILKAPKVPGAPRIENSMELTIEERIPKTVLTQLMTAFKAVYDRDKTESAGQVYRNRETKEYFVYFPEQKNTGASSEYGHDKLATEQLRTTMDFIMEAHSHCSFGAFFSGTDNANENALLFYIVLGNFNSASCSFVARAKVGDVSKTLTIGDIFEGATEQDLSLSGLPEDTSDILVKAVKNVYTYTPPARGPNGQFLPVAVTTAAAPYKPYKPTVHTGNRSKWSPRGQVGSSKPRLDLDWLTAGMSDVELQELKVIIDRRLA